MLIDFLDTLVVPLPPRCQRLWVDVRLHWHESRNNRITVCYVDDLAIFDKDAADRCFVALQGKLSL